MIPKIDPKEFTSRERSTERFFSQGFEEIIYYINALNDEIEKLKEERER